MILNYLAFHIVVELSKNKVCTRQNDSLFWNESNRLFAYFCWYVTELSEQNGLRMYKAEGKARKTNKQAFCKLFVNKNPKDIDSNAITEFKGKRNGIHIKPKGHEVIEKATKEVLKKILNTEIKEIDYDKFL